MMHKSSLFIVLFIGVFCYATPPKDSLTIQKEQTHFVEKTFAEDVTKKYTGTPFEYDSLEGTSQNLISRFLTWFFQKIADIFGFEVNHNFIHIMEIIFYSLLTIGAIYIIIKLLFGREISTFKKPDAKIEPWAFEEELLETTHLDTLLLEAIKNKNYRFAIRYLHLMVLQALSNHQLIDWHFEKTNSDYKNELKDPSLQADFEKTAYLFDYVWYGEFYIDQTAFEKIEFQFKSLLTKIKANG